MPRYAPLVCVRFVFRQSNDQGQVALSRQGRSKGRSTYHQVESSSNGRHWCNFELHKWNENFEVRSALLWNSNGTTIYISRFVYVWAGRIVHRGHQEANGLRDNIWHGWYRDWHDCSTTNGTMQTATTTRWPSETIHAITQTRFPFANKLGKPEIGIFTTCDLPLPIFLLFFSAAAASVIQIMQTCCQLNLSIRIPTAV